ncbi:MAG: hypothetical protein IIC67_02700 [Thaumarchaeota archaeon]|nr:hypothetical protein [Nitrososphaerota archaeon]
MADFWTQFAVGLVLLVPLVIIWGIQPIIKRLQGDSVLRQKQKISHSKEILGRIFEHLCSIESKGNEELELSVPVPLDEYYKSFGITDILTHDYIPKTLESIDRTFNDNEHNYTFVPISNNPLNVEWGLNHLKDKEYSHIFSNYENAEEKYKIFNKLSKELESNMNSKIQEQITNTFFENKKIPSHVYDQIIWMIKNAVMMKYTIHHRDISNVCKTTQEDIDSRQLHKVINKLLQNDVITTQRENIFKAVQDGEKSLTQFKTDLKKIVTDIRDGVLVKGNCKGCS